MEKSNGETMREIALQLCPDVDVVSLAVMFESYLHDLNDMLDYMYAKESKNDFDMKLIKRYEDRVDMCIEGIHKYNNLSYR